MNEPQTKFSRNMYLTNLLREDPGALASEYRRVFNVFNIPVGITYTTLIKKILEKEYPEEKESNG